MFRFKYGAARAGALAAVLGTGGAALAQDPAVPMTLPVPVSTAPAVPDAPPGPPGAQPAQPGAPAAAEPAPPACTTCESVFDWKKVPRVRPTPRAGFFPVPPTGPGYYSALDLLRGQALEAPPKYPYPRTSAILPSFFDVDNFAYLDDPKNTEHDFFDPLKRVHLGDNWLFTTGGEFRTRYENGYNDRLTKTDNVYQLTRTRVYADLWYRDDFRVFAEYIGAWSAYQDLAPLPIDQQKSGIQNLFADVKIADLGGDPVYVRGGRQELLFGSQRLVSTLDWANTRRTFQGVRGFRQTEKWDFDVFWVQPVVPNTNRPAAAADANKFDSVDYHQNFVGAWGTYRPKKGQVVDLYYLMLDDTNTYSVLGLPRGNFTRHTTGGRYAGNEGNFLFDTEAALQFGSQNGRDVFAAMATHGVGYNFKDTTWSPTVWAYYDYASGGNPTNGSGTDHTFNQLFPFGHYYMGWIDAVGRQNIHDLNFHLYLYPTKWLTAWVQYHNFWLADKKDALYNTAGNPIRYDPTGRSGSYVGQEVDYVFNFHLSKHADVLTGYCALYGGEFLKNTASKTNAVNSGLFFLQFSYKW
ncbi:alginate export family protein [Frigoriglobus tundricola]|uniref:Alginate export domain-containing protein n=1 Tax=Frigoriglobus tundricola TaxID=2774151 RepID=A0A6M5YWB4_9BACT|nr:alginate export family protein [Frigoriglobus tundricola]QJW97503.1 hypothetical protein FTUN_5077 [Frigoriglobus tundricola]